MQRDQRYDILFEPVRIGPVTAKNRFYQVLHCNGMGRHYPSSMIEMRRQKAEGGWAVVCTEECDIHPTSDISPLGEVRLWDDGDVRLMERVVEAVHEYDALAGIELTHNGGTVSNLYSRDIPIAPSLCGGVAEHPIQARAMDKADIAEFRRWHREAVVRAKRAGFDVIYVYAAHEASLLAQFLSRIYNQRGDEYGGSLENRVRLLRETLEETKEIAGDSCGIVLRFTVDTHSGPDGITPDGEARDMVGMLAELPDLWDVNVSDWSHDSLASRFGAEGFQEDSIAFVKGLTSKPVVGVGRYTSPDSMVSAINRGVLDMIGAARPSIADPFLPRKIEEGRADDIRECIGCNICVSGDKTMVPMRCTQNATMGEEWRRGWHPETIGEGKSDKSVLVVGAGPAGLECARALGRRGYRVTLAETLSEVGGRVAFESRLPGLQAWARVRDYREYQISKMANVEVYPSSRLDAALALEFGADHIVVATGATWRSDGMGRGHHDPIPRTGGANVLTPDDVMNGAATEGHVLVFDTDHYYMGGVVAEKLRRDGVEVTLVTPAAEVSAWTHLTLEQEMIQRRLLELGVEIVQQKDLIAIEDAHAVLSCVYTGRQSEREAAAVVLVTSRAPRDELYTALIESTATARGSAVPTVARIGDCVAPSTIAAAVYWGHRHAREFDEPDEPKVLREFVVPGVPA